MDPLIDYMDPLIDFMDSLIDFIVFLIDFMDSLIDFMDSLIDFMGLAGWRADWLAIHFSLLAGCAWLATEADWLAGWLADPRG